VSRRILIVVGIVSLVLLAAVATWQSFIANRNPGTLALAGDVRSDIRIVRAPAIQYPVPDYKVGIPASSTPGGSSGSRGSASPPRSSQPTISGMLEAVYVRQGDRVKAGQKIVQLDTTMLELGVKQAKTAAAKSHADVAVLSKALDTIDSNQGKLADARSQLANASQQLATAGQKLSDGKRTLLANRAKVVAGINQIEAVINGPHPPGPWPPPALAAQLAQLKGALAGIDKALGQLPAAQSQLAQGRAKIASGKSQLASGATALADAKKQVKKARAILTEIAKGQDVQVQLAEARMAQSIVRSPVDGVVTEARKAGTVAMVNAPLVRIQADGPTQVDTYVDVAQLRAIRLGSSAVVDFDSNDAGPLAGKVTLVANSAAFPPTSFSTDLTHMTEAVRVSITLDNGGWAPPGTPVDIRIKTNTGR
jgi:multidrug efflux pump subunit AcrA (membrane-fusion protein)